MIIPLGLCFNPWIVFLLGFYGINESSLQESPPLLNLRVILGSLILPDLRKKLWLVPIAAKGHPHSQNKSGWVGWGWGWSLRRLPARPVHPDLLCLKRQLPILTN